MTTVICLDDYHSLDRQGRKKESVTALDPKAQNFDLMYQQIKDLKDGKTVAKPIYNHVSGLLDPPEDTSAPRVRLLPSSTSSCVTFKSEQYLCLSPPYSSMLILHGCLYEAVLLGLPIHNSVLPFPAPGSWTQLHIFYISLCKMRQL